MHMAACLAYQLERIPLSLVDRQKQLLNSLNLPTCFSDVAPGLLWQAMQHDKKVEHGKLRFILPTRLGHVELVPGISEQQVLKAIALANQS